MADPTTMKQRVHLITLGVDSLDASAQFYEALGWTRVSSAPEGVVAFDLYGATLGLYRRADLARDMGRDIPRGSGAVTFACNVRDKEEVSRVIGAARAAGAEIIKAPHDVFWGGHTSYFADPDGHIWEVAWNPHAPLGPNDEFQWNGAS